MIEDLNKLNLYELNSNIDKTKDNDIVEIVKNSVYKFVTKRAFLLDFKGKGFDIVEPVEVEQVEQEIIPETIPELVVQPVQEIIEPVQQIITDIRLKDERIDNRVEDKRVDKKRIRKDA
jgi:hypothetical protein